MENDFLSSNEILKIGEVIEVDGRKVYIKVEKNKNLSDLFFNGKIIKNVSANAFVEIRKGFLSIIGKVDGEKIEVDYDNIEKNKQISNELQGKEYDELDKNKRILVISLVGYISIENKFIGGTKELPLIGNEAFIVTEDKIKIIHNIANDNFSISIAKTEYDDVDIKFPIDKLFNSHIAIFGNTGSGKSNTLAALFSALINKLNSSGNEKTKENNYFIIFDFNGEYREECITKDKTIYNLSTRNEKGGDKIPLCKGDLLNIEVLSIISEATEKTQKPFLKRSIDFYRKVDASEDPEEFMKNLLKKVLKDIFLIADKNNAETLLGHIKEVLPPKINTDTNTEEDILKDIKWHNKQCEYVFSDSTSNDYKKAGDNITKTIIYKQIDEFKFDTNLINTIIKFLYLNLIHDLISNRTQNEHIAPVINRLKSRGKDISKLFDTEAETGDIFKDNNCIVVNLCNVNLEMRKMTPLLLVKKLYDNHKKHNNTKTLNIIIDEAHNILSTESFREQDSWKDYRLETFEEIIKEGRKFGVFVTISSQRPNDISPTIISQAHNYFIHRLINQKDLSAIANSISYIDKISSESIPSLPIGVCIFSGVATQMPLKVKINELPEEHQPKSQTLTFSETLSI